MLTNNSNAVCIVMYLVIVFFNLEESQGIKDKEDLCTSHSATSYSRNTEGQAARHCAETNQLLAFR